MAAKSKVQYSSIIFAVVVVRSHPHHHIEKFELVILNVLTIIKILTIEGKKLRAT